MAEAPLFFVTPSVISSNTSAAGWRVLPPDIIIPRNAFSLPFPPPHSSSSSSSVVGKSFFICNSRLGASGGGGLWEGGSSTTVRFLAAVAEAKFVGGENDVLFLPPPARYLATPPHPTPALEKKTENRTHLSPDLEFKE